MKHPKTDELRIRWTDYVREIYRMKWNIGPDHPDHERLTTAFETLMNIAENIKSTAEIEEGDTVTNGSETFIVQKVEDDRVYYDDVHFYHEKGLRIKKKFDDEAKA